MSEVMALMWARLIFKISNVTDAQIQIQSLSGGVTWHKSIHPMTMVTIYGLFDSYFNKIFY